MIRPSSWSENTSPLSVPVVELITTLPSKSGSTCSDFISSLVVGRDIIRGRCTRNIGWSIHTVDGLNGLQEERTIAAGYLAVRPLTDVSTTLS